MMDTTIIIAATPSALLLTAWALRRIADNRACARQARMLQAAAAQRSADEEAHRRSLQHYAAMAALRRTIEHAEAGARVLTDNTLRNAGGNHGASLNAQYTMRGDNARLQDHVPAATDARTSDA